MCSGRSVPDLSDDSAALFLVGYMKEVIFPIPSSAILGLIEGCGNYIYKRHGHRKLQNLSLCGAGVILS